MPYVIAHVAGAKKPSLFKTKLSGTKLLGIIPDHRMYGENAPIVIKSDEIIVSLSDSPPIGSVYGVHVEPVMSRLLIKGWGQVFSHIEMSEAAKARVMRAFPLAMARIKKMGPACDWELRTELRNPKGNNGGTYAYRPQAEDVLVLRPIEGQSLKELVKVVTHELAHGIWYRHMDSAQRAKWILLYDLYVRVDAVSPKDIVQMIKDVRQIGGIKSYMKDNPDQQAAVLMYVSWLKKVHGIDKRELEDLISSGSNPPVPDTHIHRSETQTPLTLYSKSSATELFAEAVSCFATDDLQDQRIIKMLGDLRT